MKLFFAFFILSLLLLLLFAGSIDGRKELGEYRKNAMTEQPMAEVIRDLVPANHQEDTNSNAKKFFVDDLSQPYGVLAYIKNKPKEGRKEAVGYWKKMMKEEPMPEILQELLPNTNYQEDSSPNAKNFFVDELSQLSSVDAYIKNKPKEGRKEAGGYWKKMMKEEPMPEIFEELLANSHQEDANPKAENDFVDDLSQPYSVFAWIKNKPKEGRKEAVGYWKKVKKEQPMPAEVVQDLVHNHAEAENNANAKEEKPGFSNGESSPRHCDDEKPSPSEANQFGIKDNPIEKVTAN